MYSVISYISRKEAKSGRDLQWAWRFGFRERTSDLSLNFRQIRLSKFVGTRSKATLRIEAYTWTPVLRSFDKLREVGDLSYMGFTLYLSVL